MKITNVGVYKNMKQEYIGPLYCSYLYDDTSFYWKETSKEKFWRKVPIIGLNVVSMLHRKRVAPVVEMIEEQLASRKGVNLYDFYKDPLEIEAAKFLNQSIYDNMGWDDYHCIHFIPQDPVRIVMWAFADALDDACVILEIEEYIGRELTKQELEKQSDETLDDIVKFMVAEKQKKSQ